MDELNELLYICGVEELPIKAIGDFFLLEEGVNGFKQTIFGLCVRTIIYIGRNII